MTRRDATGHGRGFFAIGIYHPKREVNVGSLFRSAVLYGASFVFTIGERYQRQSSDTGKTGLHTPLFHFADIEDVIEHLPNSCPLVGIELHEEAVSLATYEHPMRAAYLLGAEDHGLPPEVVKRCHQLVQIESARPWSMNVACAGTVLMWHRRAGGAR